MVTGFNVQAAIGSSRVTTPATAAPDAKTAHALAIAAVALRDEINDPQQRRASRTRLASSDAKPVSAGEAPAARAKAPAETTTAVRKTSTVRKTTTARKATTTRRTAAPARAAWVRPLVRYRLSAGFGARSRLWSNRHTGQDFAAPSGTLVRSIGNGQIISSGWDGSYGKKIAVRHDDGTVSWYAHLSSYVRTSGRVRAGDVIGRVGSTGNSTGPHLHLEIRPGNGDPVPPLAWLRRHGVRM